MWLTILANALPALAGVAKDVINHDEKAGTAAQVAADPNAPPAVKQAAANVATKAIDDSAKAQKAAIAAASGKAPTSESGGSTTMLVVIGIGALLFMKRRR